MKLVIELNENSYEWLKNTIRPDVIKNYDAIHESVRKGTPLREVLKEELGELEAQIDAFREEANFVDRVFDCFDAKIRRLDNEVSN